LYACGRSIKFDRVASIKLNNPNINLLFYPVICWCSRCCYDTSLHFLTLGAFLMKFLVNMIRKICSQYLNWLKKTVKPIELFWS